MSHPNEDFQAERWDADADAEAMALREARWREFEATRMVLDGMGAPRSPTR